MNKPFSFTAQQIAEVVNGEVVGDPQCIITGVADLDSASEKDASFYSNARYASKLKGSKAGLILATREDVTEGKNFLVVSNPSAAFQKVIELFAKHMPQDHGFEGIHSQAAVDPTVKVGKNVTIGAFAFIGRDVCIGDNTVIYPGCVVSRGVTIGSDCLLYANVSVRQDCVIKNRVTIQPGAVIGSCGFGYVTDKLGKHTKLNQLGSVRIEDDVEIGALTTIDRARFQATIIGEGTKIDNLVQIGHGVVIGKHCIIVAQTGIAGSTTIGNYVVIGGQVGISGHIEIVDFVSIAAKSGVSKSLLKSGKYAGMPAMPYGEYQRMQVALKQSVRQKG